MNENSPTETTIRQYLLGRLNDQPDLEETLGRQLLFDDRLSEIVDSMEDQIIEDYLDGVLKPADKSACELYFLRPRERKKKLRLAQILRSHFEAQPEVPAYSVKVDTPKSSPQLPGHTSGRRLEAGWPFRFRIYAAVAAIAVVAFATVVYINNLRQGFHVQIDANRKVQARLEHQLAQERDRSANLQTVIQQLQPTLFFSALFRDTKTPEFQIIRFAEKIPVEIELRGARKSAYDVSLENRSGQQIWSQPKIMSSAGSLRFQIPVQSITTGDYRLLLRAKPEQSVQTYHFHARVTP